MPEYSTLGTAKADGSEISLSVIIPVLNEEKVIGKCLSALVQQGFPKRCFEVIVVDNGSMDRTSEIARTYADSLNVTILQNPKGHISALRNLGASSAKGEFLVFLDADCLALPEFLARAAELLRSGDGGVIGAFYTIPEDSSWLARAWYGDMPTEKQGRVSYVPSGTLCMSRKVFSEIGGFDETIQTSEDVELCQRVAKAGYRVMSYPELSTVHLGTPQTLAAFYRKQRWHGNGVRTEVLRDMFQPGYVKTVLQTGFTLVCLIASVILTPAAFLTNKLGLLLLAPALLLFGSLAQAMRTAANRKKWDLLASLTVLYLVYGIARSLSFVGLNGKRASRPVANAAYGACVETTPAE